MLKANKILFAVFLITFAFAAKKVSKNTFNPNIDASLFEPPKIYVNPNLNKQKEKKEKKEITKKNLSQSYTVKEDELYPQIKVLGILNGYYVLEIKTKYGINIVKAKHNFKFGPCKLKYGVVICENREITSTKEEKISNSTITKTKTSNYQRNIIVYEEK